jgi:hypothetical protein
MITLTYTMTNILCELIIPVKFRKKFDKKFRSQKNYYCCFQNHLL